MKLEFKGEISGLRESQGQLWGEIKQIRHEMQEAIHGIRDDLFLV
jgi:hypothetical protein